MNREIDVADVLPAVHVPTLVLVATGDIDFAVEHIAWPTDPRGEASSSFPGVDHFFWIGDQRYELLDEIERFVADGPRRGGRPRSGRSRPCCSPTSSGSTANGRGARRPRVARARRAPPRAGAGAARAVPRPRGRHRRRRLLRDVRRAGASRALRAGDRERGPRPRDRGPGRGPHGRGGDDRRRRSAGSRSTSGLGSPRSPAPPRSSSPRTVKDLVAGSGLAFEDAGEHELKGVPDRWHLYRAVG